MAKKKKAVKAPQAEAMTIAEAKKTVTSFFDSLSNEENFVVEIFGNGDSVQVNCHKS